jgi:hypothetical protein
MRNKIEIYIKTLKGFRGMKRLFGIAAQSYAIYRVVNGNFGSQRQIKQ